MERSQERGEPNESLMPVSSRSLTSMHAPPPQANRFITTVNLAVHWIKARCIRAARAPNEGRRLRACAACSMVRHLHRCTHLTSALSMRSGGSHSSEDQR